MSIPHDSIVSLKFFGFFTEIEERDTLLHMLETRVGCLVHHRFDSSCKDCIVAFEAREDRLTDCEDMIEGMHEEFVAFFERCLEV